MKLKVFSILDTVANAFNTPFFFPTVGQAVRAFKDLANDQNTAVARHPTDYTLYEIGEFSDENGRLVALEVPNRLGRGSDFTKVEGLPANISGTDAAELAALVPDDVAEKAVALLRKKGKMNG